MGKKYYEDSNYSDVIIVGAGPAGIGTALILNELGINYRVLEKTEIGASFRMFSKQTRLLTPSFTNNAFGNVDLNSVNYETSPAFTFEREHLTGNEYAQYLSVISEYYKLNVEEGVDIVSLDKNDDGFILKASVDNVEYKARFVVWATGEFQYPTKNLFEGEELCKKYNEIRNFNKIKGEKITIIGGYESGIDSAIHLIEAGKKVSVVDPRSPWTIRSVDPSVSLSPYTMQRLDELKNFDKLKFVDSEVEKVIKGKNKYKILLKNSKVISSDTKPILATGYVGGQVLIEDFFEKDENNNYKLTENDESTITNGLFLAGPKVRHANAIFCFICKFRQRLPIISEKIAQDLMLDLKELDSFKRAGLYLRDLSCCEDDCAC